MNSANKAPNEVDRNNVNTESAYLVSGELLRSLIGERTKRSPFQWLRHPLLLVILSGIFGAWLTNYYVTKQQESARRQSFLDGINNARMPKLGEVWEQLDSDELKINELLEGQNDVKDGKKRLTLDDRVEQITTLIRNDQVIAGKYRFWLGEDLYRKTEGYLDASIEYAVKKIGSPPETDLSGLLKRREAAKQDIIQIRELFLQGEAGPPVNTERRW